MDKPILICAFEYNGEELLLMESRYADGNTAILVETNNTHEPYATLSVNIPDMPPPSNDYFYVKTWAENAEIVEVIRNKTIPDIFTDTGLQIPTGFVSAEAWHFTEKRF